MNIIVLLNELAIALFKGDCADERCHKRFVPCLEFCDAKRTAKLGFVVFPSEFTSKTTYSSSNGGVAGGASSSSSSSNGS
jgi:hypothetical protein